MYLSSQYTRPTWHLYVDIDLCGARIRLLQVFQRSNLHYDKHEDSSPKLAAIFLQNESLLTTILFHQEKLAADVRVETERRLKALEAELAQAEHANKERAMAARYHKVKFFGKLISVFTASGPIHDLFISERQKVTRKIIQTEKRLSSEASDVSKKKLEATLHELRIDLNYILVC